jgi:hypothetical protein
MRISGGARAPMRERKMDGDKNGIINYYENAMYLLKRLCCRKTFFFIFIK